MIPDELTTRLSELHHRTATAAAALTRATSLLPGTTTGQDPTAAITATLDADDQPIGFRVAHDWSRRLPAESVAAAVVAACHTASAHRLRDWGEELRRHHAVPTCRHSTAVAADRVSTTAPADTHAEHPPPPADPARSAASLLERLSAAYDAARREPVASAPAVGSAPGGTLTVTLTDSGLTACTVNQAWLADQSAASLTNALGAAVQDARHHRARPDQAVNPHPDPADDLAAEAIALLQRLDTAAQHSIGAPSTSRRPR